jgi:hypothetical protein
MANLIAQVSELNARLNIRYLRNANQCDDKTLDEYGYYRGYVCPHNHDIRDQDNHWCYYCVQKIWKNVCGFDINYLDPNYKHKYAAIWNRINVTTMDECWHIRGNSKRACLPSYRSHYAKQSSEYVSLHKAVYQCAWGDVGKFFVTRVCGNPECFNPVHMLSSWNRDYPPGRIHPLVLEFEPSKLMCYARARKKVQADALAATQYKQTITNPREAGPPPEYDEG